MAITSYKQALDFVGILYNIFLGYRWIYNIKTQFKTFNSMYSHTTDFSVLSGKNVHIKIATGIYVLVNTQPMTSSIHFMVYNRHSEDWL